MSAAESHAYWAGWYDSLVVFGWENWALMTECEGNDWYEQDVAMFAALSG